MSATRNEERVKSLSRILLHRVQTSCFGVHFTPACGRAGFLFFEPCLTWPLVADALFPLPRRTDPNKRAAQPTVYLYTQVPFCKKGNGRLQFHQRPAHHPMLTCTSLPMLYYIHHVVSDRSAVNCCYQLAELEKVTPQH